MKLISVKPRVALAQDFAVEERQALAAAIEHHAKASAALAALQCALEAANDKLYERNRAVEAAAEALANYDERAAKWLAGSLMGQKVGAEPDHKELQRASDNANREVSVARKARHNIEAAIVIAEADVVRAERQVKDVALSVLKLAPAAGKKASKVAELQREFLREGSDLSEIMALGLIDLKSQDIKNEDAAELKLGLWRARADGDYNNKLPPGRWSVALAALMQDANAPLPE